MPNALETRAEQQSVWRTHLAVLFSIVAVSSIAALRPEWLLHLPNRCGMQLLFRLKCPFCGMTRDFVSIWQHRTPVNNPGSWFAAAFIYVVYPVLLVWAWIRRRPEVFQHPLLRRSIYVAVALLWVANNVSR